MKLNPVPTFTFWLIHSRVCVLLTFLHEDPARVQFHWCICKYSDFLECHCATHLIEIWRQCLSHLIWKTKTSPMVLSLSLYNGGELKFVWGVQWHVSEIHYPCVLSETLSLLFQTAIGFFLSVSWPGEISSFENHWHHVLFLIQFRWDLHIVFFKALTMKVLICWSFS